jgi:hypothetical protein
MPALWTLDEFVNIFLAKCDSMQNFPSLKCDSVAHFAEGLTPILPVLWTLDEFARYATATPHADRGRYHLIVERLPSRMSWDWAVWRHGTSPDLAATGEASTAEAAMSRAETRLAFAL